MYTKVLFLATCTYIQDNPPQSMEEMEEYGGRMFRRCSPISMLCGKEEGSADAHPSKLFLCLTSITRCLSSLVVQSRRYMKVQKYAFCGCVCVVGKADSMNSFGSPVEEEYVIGFCIS